MANETLGFANAGVLRTFLLLLRPPFKTSRAQL